MPVPDDAATLETKLVAERARLLAAFAGLSDELMVRPYDGGWSIRDLLAHVAMAEEMNVKFARMMVEKDTPVQLREFAVEFPDFPGEFSLDKFNGWMAARWRDRSLRDVLTALSQTRGETLAWLRSLSPAQLERHGEHAVWGDQTVRGIFRILVLHDKSHRGDIEKRK